MASALQTHTHIHYHLRWGQSDTTRVESAPRWCEQCLKVLLCGREKESAHRGAVSKASASLLGH